MKPPRPALWDDLQPLLAGRTFTDLTHAFHPGQPHFPAFPDEIREAVFDLEKGDGFTAHRYSIIGQWGTHVDPPSHFIRGGRTLDQIPVEDMVLPLVILDITDRVGANADATALRWRTSRHGSAATAPSRRAPLWPCGPGGAVAGPTRTPWQTGTTRASATRRAGRRKFSTFLIEERSVAAVGHEQTDTDPGLATSRQDFSLETYVLAQNRWQIELTGEPGRTSRSGRCAHCKLAEAPTGQRLSRPGLRHPLRRVHPATRIGSMSKTSSMGRGIMAVFAVGSRNAEGLPGGTVADIAADLGKDRSQVSRSLRSAEQEGFLERRDQRSYTLNWSLLTDAQLLTEQRLQTDGVTALEGLGR